MKVFFVQAALSVLLLALPGLAAAAEWTVVHVGPEGNQYYYDASKLTISGNEITYWKKVLFKKPLAYKGQLAASALYRERIHCGDFTVKPLSHVIHAVGGGVIEQIAAEGEASAIIPDTFGDLFEAALCPQVRAKRDESPRKTTDKPEGKMDSPPPELNNQEIPPGTL